MGKNLRGLFRIDARPLDAGNESVSPLGIAEVVLIKGPFLRILARSDLLEVFAVKVEGNDAGNHNHERNNQLHGRREYDAFLSFLQRSRTQNALGDVLIESPVVKVWNPESNDQRRPGNVAVPAWQIHAHFFVVQRDELFQTARRIGDRARIGGAGGQFGNRRCAQFAQREIGDHRAAHHECDALNQVRPGRRVQSAGGNVSRRHQTDDPAPGAQTESKRAVAGEEFTHRQATRINHPRQRHEHQQDHHHERHDGARGISVAMFEKLRHRENASLEEVRKKAKRHYHQGDCRHPFVTADGHTEVIGSGTRHANELLGGNVGRNERNANQPPLQSASGQKVRFAVLAFTTALEQAEGNDANDENNEYDQVDWEYLERFAHGLTMVVELCFATTGGGLSVVERKFRPRDGRVTNNSVPQCQTNCPLLPEWIGVKQKMRRRSQRQAAW